MSEENTHVEVGGQGLEVGNSGNSPAVSSQPPTTTLQPPPGPYPVELKKLVDAIHVADAVEKVLSNALHIARLAMDGADAEGEKLIREARAAKQRLVSESHDAHAKALRDRDRATEDRSAASKALTTYIASTAPAN